MRLTFRAKLIAIVGITALAFLLIILAGALTAERVERQLATIQDHYIPKVELEPQLDGTLEKLRRSFQDAVAAHDGEALAATAQLKSTFVDQLGAARNAVDPTEAAALRTALEDYYAAAYDVSRRLIADETGEALVDAIAAMQRRQARVAAALKGAAVLDRGELAEAFAAATRAEADARASRLWISLSCMGAVVLLSTWLGSGVLRSLAGLTSGLVRFGKGDFGHPIRVAARDELGDVAEHANRMAADLERLGRETRKAEEKFRALIESAPDALVIVDRGGRIVLVNQQTERLFGYARQELLGRDVDMIVPQRLRGAGYFTKPEGPAMETGLELYGLRSGAKEFPIEITVVPLDTEEGALVSSAIRDVTERKRVEEALRLSNRELEAFSYSVAHDLRAPLRGINGFSSALMEDCADTLDAQAKDYLNRIAAGAARMGELIDALLALSRITRAELQREPVNMTEIADAIASQLRASQPERVVDFAIQKDVVGYGDPRLLRALLENLLGNAWKFTSARTGSRIAFGSVGDDGARTFFVEDNGAGFDMAYAEKLFAPFQRLHSASQFAGTGIGLATVQRIVHRHGGRIWARGAVERGATFQFTLPTSGGGATA